jgi:alanyl-tRNA synthetase
MDAQRERARSASQFGADYGEAVQIEGETEFTGYDHLAGPAKVQAIYQNGQPVEQLGKGEAGMLVLDRTPFYAEGGGQVGDTGRLQSGSGKFTVEDTRKQGGKVFLHFGKVSEGTIKVGEQVEASVDAERRQATAYNHSATHLLHAALRRVLGDHVTQKGSLVDADRLRFDFSHFEPISSEQLQEIETLVNEHIRANHPVETQVMTPDAAVAAGALALFGEKYGEEVRVLRMGDFSMELCGGTHVDRTGDIGLFKIVDEGGVAAGVRRIEAVTGQRAVEWVEQNEAQLNQLAGLLKGSRENLTDRIKQLLEQNRQMEKEVERLKAKLASSQGSDLADQAREIDGLKVLAARLDGADPKSLRDTVDQLKNKLGSAAVVLATVDGDKISLVAGVSKDSTDRLKAGELVNMVAQQVGGKGGGRPDMAQAGGSQPEALEAALASVPDWVREQLAGA